MASQLRGGMAIRFENQPYKVVSAEYHPGQGKMGGVTHARLKNLAALTGRSKTYYATEAICEHIDDLEDLYLAERELEAIRAGKSQTVPLEEVMKRYGMEG